MADTSLDAVGFLSPDLQRAYATALKAERKPIQQLSEKKTNLEKKVELLNDVLGKVEAVRKVIPSLNSPTEFRELALQSSDEKTVSGSVDKTLADPGSHNLEIRQLASHASAISNGFADKDETRIGSGFFTFNTQDGDTKEVYLDNPTLDELAQIINRSGNGLRATVINDQSDPDNPYRLVLNGSQLGQNNNLTYPDFYLVDGDQDFFIEREKPATNAMVQYEGFGIESPTNELKDLIKGVTLNLKGLSDPGHPSTLTISQDIPKMTQKVKDFVEKINQIFTFIQSQNKLDEKSDTSKTLGGDYGIRVTEERLRSALSQNFILDPSKTVRYLGDVGVQFTKNGTLSFDEKKFEVAINKNYDEVVDLISGDSINYGIIPKVSRALDTISGRENAVLSTQQKTFNDQINRLKDDIDRKEKRAEANALELRSKLGRVQSAISSMQEQGAYLNSQLGAASSGANQVAALLG